MLEQPGPPRPPVRVEAQRRFSGLTKRLAERDAVPPNRVRSVDHQPITVRLKLAAIGVYGLTAAEIASRRQELAVRVALGATRRQVLAAVMRPGALAIGFGLAVGLTATLGAGRWMTSLLYEVKPTDPATLAIVLSILGATGLAAATLAAAHVLRTDPAPVLRAE